MVFLDLVMPNLGGVEVLKTIKNLSPTTPVFIVSAYIDDYIKETCSKHHATGILEKPIKLDTFFDLIDRTLNAAHVSTNSNDGGK